VSLHADIKEESAMGRIVFRAMKFMALLALALGALAVSSSGILAADGSLGLNFSIQPYLWMPTIETDLKFTAPDGSTGEPTIKVEPDDYLEDVDIALLLTAEMRKGRWSLVADFVFMEVSSKDNSVKQVDFGGPVISTNLDMGTEVDTKSFIATFGPGYQIIDGPRLQMDVVAGLRYLWIESDVDWDLSGKITGPGPGQSFARSGSFTQDADAWNGVGGIRGQIRLGAGNWFIPFYGDIGAGDSDLTWSVYSALGYSFNDRFGMMMGYRHMEWDGDDRIQNLSLSGPIIGARFNF
jgi:hypothetical protein